MSSLHQQNIITFHSNPKYGFTKSYGLFLCRKSLETVKSPGHQWVKTIGGFTLDFSSVLETNLCVNRSCFT